MKKLFILVAWCALSVSTHAQQDTATEKPSVQEKVTELEKRQEQTARELNKLMRTNKDYALRIGELEADGGKLSKRLDSLQAAHESLAGSQKADKDTLATRIDATDDKVRTNEAELASRTGWGIAAAAVLLVAIGGLTGWFLRKSKRSSTSIDEVRRTQDALEQAQKSLQEESVKLDNKLIEVIEKQFSSMPSQPQGAGAAEVDHSLALKVADEIVRMELNLSRMDASIKGHKQLSKAVERIKNNFLANGYEIVDMLGKTYNDGMKAVVTFVTDNNLEPGQQIITRIIKPQINYQQQMIQVAEIEVSQPE